MLILTRKIQESIMIGDDIKVYVLGSNMHKVKLGIIAGEDVPILRTEIYSRYQTEIIKKKEDKNRLITIYSKAQYKGK